MTEALESSTAIDLNATPESVRARWELWRARRAVLERARSVSREAPRLLRRARETLSLELLWTIADAVRELRGLLAARHTRDWQALDRHSRAVEALVEHHLADARPAGTWEFIEAVLTALVLALFIRGFLFEAFRIPSGSMLPTLLVGDHIFVSKFVYGVRIPFTDRRLLDLRKPARGEIIVFEYTGPGPDRGKDFIKRVMGTPGDRIRLVDSVWHVNGEPAGAPRLVARQVKGTCAGLEASGPRVHAPDHLCTVMKESARELTWLSQHVADDPVAEPQDGHDWPPPASTFPTSRIDRLQLAELCKDDDRDRTCEYRTTSECRWRFLCGWPRPPTTDSSDELRRSVRFLQSGDTEMVVPEGHVFVMGDNRDNSQDSRYWGVVPLERIVGKAGFIWWAWEDVWSRLFRRVH